MQNRDAREESQTNASTYLFHEDRNFKEVQRPPAMLHSKNNEASADAGSCASR